MEAVDPNIQKLIIELQKLQSFDGFPLGGGTNLAIWYNHRHSYDIDLFTDKMVGIQEFKKSLKRFGSV